MKRILLGLTAILVLSLPSFSFSTNSIYGIYTDSAAFRQKPEVRDISIDIKQFISDTTKKVLKTDNSVINTVLDITKKNSTKPEYTNLTSKINSIRCESNLSEAEQNTQILQLLSSYCLNRPVSDNTLSKNNIKILSESLKQLSSLKNQEQEAEDFLKLVNNINKRDNFKTDLEKISELLDSRINSLSLIIKAFGI